MSNPDKKELDFDDLFGTNNGSELVKSNEQLDEGTMMQIVTRAIEIRNADFLKGVQITFVKGENFSLKKDPSGNGTFIIECPMNATKDKFFNKLHAFVIVDLAKKYIKGDTQATKTDDRRLGEALVNLKERDERDEIRKIQEQKKKNWPVALEQLRQKIKNQKKSAAETSIGKAPEPEKAAATETQRTKAEIKGDMIKALMGSPTEAKDVRSQNVKRNGQEAISAEDLLKSITPEKEK